MRHMKAAFTEEDDWAVVLVAISDYRRRNGMEKATTDEQRGETLAAILRERAEVCSIILEKIMEGQPPKPAANPPGKGEG